jgi:Undecaprenyl-phosphate glucose phosphotransferase
MTEQKVQSGPPLPDVADRALSTPPRPAKLAWRWGFFRYLLRLLDATGVVFAGMTASLITEHSFSPPPHVVMLMYFSAVVFAIAAQYFGCYNKLNLKQVGEQVESTLAAGFVSVVVVLSGALISHEAATIKLAWATDWLGLAAAVIIANRIALSHSIHRLQAAGHLRDRVAVVGATPLAATILANILKAKSDEVALLGLYDDAPTRPDSQLSGSIDDLVGLARRSRVDRIVLALAGTEDDRLPALLTRLRNVPARVELCLAENVWRFGSNDANRLCGVPLVTLANGRIDGDITTLKNIEDRVISPLLLIALMPLLLLIALAVKLDSQGPVLFRQPRYGLNNRVFDVYKFRTMRQDTGPSDEVRQATRDDPRVTRIGSFLRRSSLDELPQLLNVVRGEMSLIGPRPHAVPHNIKYAGLIDEYLARHNLKPGITGWAQVNGLRGETDTDDKMRQRIEYDLYYVENWSIILDIRIILLTFLKVWTQKTAY